MKRGLKERDTKKKSLRQDSESEEMLKRLEELAERINVEICYDNLLDRDINTLGGHCKLNGKDIIILEKNLSIKEKLNILIRELSKFNLKGIYLPPVLRNILEPAQLKIDD